MVHNINNCNCIAAEHFNFISLMLFIAKKKTWECKMELKECASYFSPVGRNQDVVLRFSTTLEEIEDIYNKLPYDSLSSLEFKNIVGLIMGREPIEKIQTKFELEQSATYSCTSSSTPDLGTRRIIIEKEDKT
jgi:hypothetical protein